MYKVTLVNDGKETVIHSPFFNNLKLVAGTIKHGINVASSFTFTILPDNPGYKLIRPLKTLIQVFNTKTQKVEFDGRILMPTESMSDSGSFAKSFVCESELGYLNDSAQRHGEYHDITVKDFLQVIIDNHNRDVADDEIDKTFKVGIVDVDSSTGTLYRYLGYEPTLDTIDDKLISRLGGELRVRKENGVRYLDYLKSVGEHRSTEIRLAKNLKSITKEVDPTEIITRLIPLGEALDSEDEEATDASQRRLTIEEVNDGKDYIDDPEAMSVFGVIAKSVVWDDITVPSILKTRGEQYLRNNNRVKAQHEISALDLSILEIDPDSFEVGNWHPVINPVMNINENLRIVGKSIDIIEPENNDLNIGDQFKKASEYQHDAMKAERKVIDLESTVTRQSKRVVELSKASQQAQQEIERLQQVIADADVENLDQVLQQINNQLGGLYNNIGDIGQEITSLQESVSALNDFKTAQEQINFNQNTFNQNQLNINADVEARLQALENMEGGTNG